MKNLILITIIVTIILGCDQKKESKDLNTPKVQQISDSILVFAKQYNAVVGWDTSDTFSTIQFEELINKKRPILINEEVFWVSNTRLNESNRLLLSNATSKYSFDLVCDSLQKTEILNRGVPGGFFDLIAIAEIKSATKRFYNNGRSITFKLKGKLVDLLKN